MGFDFTDLKKRMIDELSNGQYSITLDSGKNTAEINIETPNGSSLEIKLKNVNVSTNSCKPSGKGYLDSLTLETNFGRYTGRYTYP